MNARQRLGLILLVAGVVLLYFGWELSQSFGDQLARTVTGRFTDETMGVLIGGAVAVIAGAFAFFYRK